MTDSDNPEREVVCTLPEEDQPTRSEDVQTLLIAHYVDYELRENGVEIRFDGTDESLQAIAQFTSNELQCCSFAEYEITVSPPYEETVLTVTGPEGTRTMFREGLVERLEQGAT